MAGVVACASPTSKADGGAVGDDASTSNGGSASGGGAIAPPADSPCTNEGATVACGDVLQHHGDYVSCSQGTRTCQSGMWSVCEGDRVAQVWSPQSALPGAQVQGLSTGATGCVANPCDPYCTGYNDTSTGALSAGNGAGGGLAYDPTTMGITLPPEQALGYSCTGLTITPSTAVATVTSIPPLPAAVVVSYTSAGVAWNAKFAAQIIGPGCTDTTAAVWTLDQAGEATVSTTGTFSVFDAIPNQVHVTAFASGFSATGTASVVVNAWDVTNAPMGVTPTSFAGTSTHADAITWLYPYDNTVYPLRLQPPVPQWSATNAASSVRVILRYPADGSLFTWSGIQAESQALPAPSNALTARPRGIIPSRVWSALEQVAQGDNAYISVQRIVSGVLRQENPQHPIRLSRASLRGTVYYQSYGSNLVHNYPGAYCDSHGGCGAQSSTFGAATLAIKPGNSAPVLTIGDDGHCYVCHSVSANGGRLVTVKGTDYSASLELDLTNNSTNDLPGSSVSNWPAISPDATFFMSNGSTRFGQSSSNNSVFYKLPSGAAKTVTGMPAVRATTPSFSPETTHVAFNDDTLDGSSLSSIDFNATTNTVSNYQTLARPNFGGNNPSAGNIYYPAYLPQTSGGGVVYELETTSNGRDVGGTRAGCDQAGPVTCQNEGTHAELWWVHPTTHKSVRLDKANGLGYAPSHPAYTANPSADPQFNYEPTVNPHEAGGYAWVLFTSRRAYGNTATINPFWSDPRFEDLRFEPTPKKLWVAAVDPNAPSGVDPSHPAFYLPGQELLAGNSRGYWVVDACIPSGATATCESNVDCCAGTGIACTLDAAPATTRHCTTNAGPACKLATQACSVDTDCCGNPTFKCTAGTCQPPVPPTFFFEAEYDRDYNSVCPDGTFAEWTNFGLEALTPGPGTGGDYSYIEVWGAQADTEAHLATATMKKIGTMMGPPANQSTNYTNFDVSAALGVPSGPWVRIAMKLYPTLDHKKAPTILDWRQQFDCKPSE